VHFPSPTGDDNEKHNDAQTGNDCQGHIEGIPIQTVHRNGRAIVFAVGEVSWGGEF
jgi:hypothetical protein